MALALIETCPHREVPRTSLLRRSRRKMKSMAPVSVERLIIKRVQFADQ